MVLALLLDSSELFCETTDPFGLTGLSTGRRPPTFRLNFESTLEALPDADVSFGDDDSRDSDVRDFAPLLGAT
jgi:hypothetical protein